MASDSQLVTLIRQSGASYGLEQLLSAALPRTTGPAPLLVAGANNGGTPPAPILLAGSTDGRGAVNFGSGTAPAAGEQVVVSFAVPYGAAPVVSLSGGNSATDALGAIYPAQVTTTGFRVRTTAAPNPSQSNTTYLVAYRVDP
jgi:hypothetical protein